MTVYQHVLTGMQADTAAAFSAAVSQTTGYHRTDEPT